MLNKSLYDKKVQQQRWNTVWAGFGAYLVLLLVGLYLQWPDKLLLAISIVALLVVCNLATVSFKEPEKPKKGSFDLREAIPSFTEPRIIASLSEVLEQLESSDSKVHFAKIMDAYTSYDCAIVDVAKSLLHNQVEYLYIPVVGLEDRRLRSIICQAFIKSDSGAYLDLGNIRVADEENLKRLHYCVTIRKLQNIRKASTIRKNLHYICEIPNIVMTDIVYMKKIMQFFSCQFFPLDILYLKITAEVDLREPHLRQIINELKGVGVRFIVEQASFYRDSLPIEADIIYYDWSRTIDDFSAFAKRERNTLKSLKQLESEAIVVNIDNQQDFLEVRTTIFKHACGKAFGLPKPLEDIYG